MPMAHGFASPSSPPTPAIRLPPSMLGRAGPGLPRSHRSRASRGSAGPRRSPARALSMRRNAAARSAVGRGFAVAGAPFKSETYRYLRLAVPTDEEIAAGATAPPGFIHLPRGAEAEWIKQLVAEQLVTVTTRRGFQKLEWQKLRERNEVLDCRVYARAAAWIAGADRWSGAKWRGLEDQLGPAPGQTEGNRAGDEPAPVTAGMLARASPATGKRRSA